ncbi:MAG: lipopolysaccharide transport periplasmic protein LptA [Methylophilales bacterium 16-45-9]|nr:MAG: lipopolysaccharide transport periplasmic protein LptA [Methylophilales bacterium 16-45-9]
MYTHACVLSILLCLPLQVWAEAADRDQPIELEADTVTVNDAKKTSTYSGKVILTQGTLVIHADKLVVREDDKVQLYTKAWVKRGEDIVHGDFISYDANAEYAEVVGGVKSNTEGGNTGRVKAIIQPKNKPTAPKTPDKTSENSATTSNLRFNKTLQLGLQPKEENQ